MACINFETLHSVTTSGDRILIRAVSGNALFEFTLGKLEIAMLIPLLQQAARNLPPAEEGKQVIALGFQPIVDTASGQPGIAITLSENLEIPLLLGQLGIDALRACIDQIASGNTLQSTAH